MSFGVEELVALPVALADTFDGRFGESGSSSSGLSSSPPVPFPGRSFKGRAVVDGFETSSTEGRWSSSALVSPSMSPVDSGSSDGLAEDLGAGA